MRRSVAMRCSKLCSNPLLPSSLRRGGWALGTTTLWVGYPQLLEVLHLDQTAQVFQSNKLAPDGLIDRRVDRMRVEQWQDELLQCCQGSLRAGCEAVGSTLGVPPWVERVGSRQLRPLWLLDPETAANARHSVINEPKLLSCEGSNIPFCFDLL